MAELNWTGEAQRWLQAIHDYLATDAPPAAGRVVQGINRKAQMLSDFPEMGHRYESLSDIIYVDR